MAIFFENHLSDPNKFKNQLAFLVEKRGWNGYLMAKNENTLCLTNIIGVFWEKIKGTLGIWGGDRTEKSRIIVTTKEFLEKNKNYVDLSDLENIKMLTQQIGLTPNNCDENKLLILVDNINNCVTNKFKEKNNISKTDLSLKAFENTHTQANISKIDETSSKYKILEEDDKKNFSETEESFEPESHNLSEKKYVTAHSLENKSDTSSITTKLIEVSSQELTNSEFPEEKTRKIEKINHEQIKEKKWQTALKIVGIVGLCLVGVGLVALIGLPFLPMQSFNYPSSKGLNIVNMRTPPAELPFHLQNAPESHSNFFTIYTGPAEENRRIAQTEINKMTRDELDSFIKNLNIYETNLSFLHQLFYNSDGEKNYSLLSEQQQEELDARLFNIDQALSPLVKWTTNISDVDFSATHQLYHEIFNSLAEKKHINHLWDTQVNAKLERFGLNLEEMRNILRSAFPMLKESLVEYFAKKLNANELNRENIYRYVFLVVLRNNARQLSDDTIKLIIDKKGLDFICYEMSKDQFERYIHNLDELTFKSFAEIKFYYQEIHKKELSESILLELENKIKCKIKGVWLKKHYSFSTLIDVCE